MAEILKQHQSEIESSGPAQIRLVDVSKSFGDMHAVDGVNLTIEPGCFFAMLGPSGCGKTTTLRMIGGFEQPSSGVVYLGGEEITDLPPFKRDVNTVFQSYALFPHLNVARNVAFGLERKGVAKGEIKTRVAQVLELTQLTELSSRKPAQLSGGQQQRVALARALVNRPRALLLDEPLGALDLRLRKQLQIELKRIQRDVGITFVHVTHDQEEAMTMADQIAVMRNGQIEQLGTAVDLYERPVTGFVANFLGDSNLIDVEPVGTGRGGFSELKTVSGDLLRVPTERLTVFGSNPVRLGVRPEKITLVADTDSNDDPTVNRLVGRVTEASYLGVSIRYLIVLADGQELSVVAQNYDLPDAGQIGPGREITLQWDVSHSFIVER